MKNVCVVTGSRAEYGIMRALLLKLNKEQNIKLDVVVTAMHLEEKYGNTYRQIEEDGLNIIKKIPLNLENTSKKCVSKSLALLTTGLSELFEKVKYNLIIILGDRYEMLPVVNVALIYNIPVCHLHGGEKTLGNFDESIRHAITKMSHLHLVASEEFKNRVLCSTISSSNLRGWGSIETNPNTSRSIIRTEQASNIYRIELRY